MANANEHLPTITLNIDEVDRFMAANKDGNMTLGDDSKEIVTNDISFMELLAALFGHEIEHTTDENFTLAAQGQNFESPAYNISDKILSQTKENNKEDQKKKASAWFESTLDQQREERGSIL